jgi:hypothetical protein
VLIARADAALGCGAGSDSDEEISLTDSVIDTMYQEASRQKRVETNAKAKQLFRVDHKPTKLKKPEVKQVEFQK